MGNRSLSIPGTLSLQGCFVFLIAAICIFPAGAAHAQKGNLGMEVKPQKPKRVFYGQASFYANKFNGRKTANGEIFDQKKLTCACNVLPLGTWVKVTNLRNGRSVVVKVNDRIHPRMKRVVDLSRAAAQKLGYISRGLTRVKVEVIDKKDIP